MSYYRRTGQRSIGPRKEVRYRDLKYQCSIPSGKVFFSKQSIYKDAYICESCCMSIGPVEDEIKEQKGDSKGLAQMYTSLFGQP